VYNVNILMVTTAWNDVRDLTRKIRLRIGFNTTQTWKNAPAIFDAQTLKILGHPVMEGWETPYMKVLAGIATRNSGVILEVGYGMGISGRFIQQANITKHIIIEANHDVAEKARAFANTSPNPVEILEGLWDEVIDAIPDDSLDGILFDTYPLSEDEIHTNHFKFFPTAFKKLKIGGVFTYYSDEITDFSAKHRRLLLESGFSNIGKKVVEVQPSVGCQYWKSSSIIAPVVTK